MRIVHIKILGDEMKRCGCCAYYMRLNHFSKNRNHIDNLNNFCNNCCALHTQKRALKKNPAYVYVGQYETYIPGTTIYKQGGIIKVSPYKYILGQPFKRCSKCKRWKTLSNFCKNKNALDKLSFICKLCSCRNAGGKKGRPLGHRLSKTTKAKLSKSMTGKIATDEHRRNISKAMMGNQHRRTDYSTLTTDLLYTYQDLESGAWISRYKEQLDTADGIRTEKNLNNDKWKEVSLKEKEDNSILGISPESLLIIREEHGEEIWDKE